MTYIGYLNQFWKAQEEYMFPASYIALYVYLLKECNRRNWQMPFSCSTVMICEMLRISKSTLTTARTTLAEAGLISFVDGRSRHVPSKYVLNELTDNYADDLTDELTDNLTGGQTHIYSKDRDNRQTEREMIIPSVADVESYMATCVIPDGYVLKEGIPQRFCDYYDSNGWMVSNTPMADWKASARKWTKDTKNLTKKGYGTEKRYSESGRVDNRSEAKNFLEELEQRSLRSANRE